MLGWWWILILNEWEVLLFFVLILHLRTITFDEEYGGLLFCWMYGMHEALFQCCQLSLQNFGIFKYIYAPILDSWKPYNFSFNLDISIEPQFGHFY